MSTLYNIKKGTTGIDKNKRFAVSRAVGEGGRQ